LEFAIATCARTEEARGVTWAEIDMEAELWTVPGARMKASLLHTVPLNAVALRLLREVPRFADTSLVFPGPRTNAAISETGLRQTVYRCAKQMPGTPKATPHGMRGSFKQWAQSRPGHEDAVSELCLAHVDTNETRAAYSDHELIDKRRVLMAEWGRYCDTAPAGGNVVPLRREA
jgi:integrase